MPASSNCSFRSGHVYVRPDFFIYNLYDSCAFQIAFSFSRLAVVITNSATCFTFSFVRNSFTTIHAKFDRMVPEAVFWSVSVWLSFKFWKVIISLLASSVFNLSHSQLWTFVLSLVMQWSGVPSFSWGFVKRTWTARRLDSSSLWNGCRGLDWPRLRCCLPVLNSKRVPSALVLSAVFLFDRQLVGSVTSSNVGQHLKFLNLCVHLRYCLPRFRGLGVVFWHANL